MNSLKYVLCLAFIMGSCVTDNSSHDSENELDASTPPPPAGEVWICHNPDTEFHDKVCVEGVYPDGCYVHNDNTAYCWLLRAEDCAAEVNDAPWKKHCPEL